MKQTPISPVVLVILDGWGHRDDATHNAIKQSKTPVFDSLWQKYPHTLLKASGLAVGLPEGQMGNSEIGHTTIGAGAVLDTDLVRIKKSIDSGEFYINPALVAVFDHVKKYNSTLHVQGLVGTGGVHAHSDHLIAILEAAKRNGVAKVALHLFTDGRDTAPQSAGAFLKEIESAIERIGVGFIASMSGRYFAMDRDRNYDRIAKTEEALFECKGNVCTISPSAFVENLYKEGKIDELLEPMVCANPFGTGCKIEKNDAVFFFNFRADRARQLSEKILEKTGPMNLGFGTLTEYCKDYVCHVAFPPLEIKATLAKQISEAGLTQAHIAETEKFPHATYFLNGGVEKPYPGEKHILLHSHKGAHQEEIFTHDMKPEMQAVEIAEKAVEEVNAGANFIFINIANADMVGHTANVPAIITSVETADRALGMITDAVRARGGICIITADHGNAEVNIDPETGKKHTSHTTNPVPAIVTREGITLKENKGLADIAPTVLTLLGVTQPKEMTGESIIN
jgi:2,3-bisphosphoglycerate-independent phosphoglycerate mutase